MTQPVPERTLGEAAYRVFLPSEATELDEKELGKVRCVIVTPERAVLDAIAELIVLPMFDGELGVLAGRAPLVGRLGPGELRFKTGNAVATFFVDGGFAQVRANVVTVLTARAVKVEEVTAAKAADALTQAEALPSGNAAERTSRRRAIERAQSMSRVAAKHAAR